MSSSAWTSRPRSTLEGYRYLKSAGRRKELTVALWSGTPGTMPSSDSSKQLRLNTRECTHLTRAIQQYSVSFHSGTAVTAIQFQNMCIITLKNPSGPFVITAPSPYCLVTINPLSLQICCFWMFHEKGILPYVVFCGWLLSFSLMFLKSAFCSTFQ